MKFIVKVPIYVCKDMMFILNSQELCLFIFLKLRLVPTGCNPYYAEDNPFLWGESRIDYGQ